jgi:hypothetical protein
MLQSHSAFSFIIWGNHTVSTSVLQTMRHQL